MVLGVSGDAGQAGAEGGFRRALVLGGARSGKSAFAERLALEWGGPVLYVATAEALDGEMMERVALHRARRPAEWRTLEAPRGVAEAVAREVAPGSTVLLEDLTLWLSNEGLVGRGDGDDSGSAGFDEAGVANGGGFGKGEADFDPAAKTSDDVSRRGAVGFDAREAARGSESERDESGFDPRGMVRGDGTGRRVAGFDVGAEGRVIGEMGRLMGLPCNLVLVSNEVGMGLVPPYPLGRAFRDALGRVNQAAARLASEAYLLVAGLPLQLKPAGGPIGSGSVLDVPGTLPEF